MRLAISRGVWRRVGRAGRQATRRAASGGLRGPALRWPAFAAAVLAFAAMAACATGGGGSNPPLPGGNFVDDAQSADGGGPGDDAAAGVDGGPSASGDGGNSCNDLVHGLRALFAIPPMACATSTDCPAGDCCFVGNSGSACVMQ